MMTAGMETIVGKITIDPKFREEFFNDPKVALTKVDVTLTPDEINQLIAVAHQHRDTPDAVFDPEIRSQW